jgi:WD40 repeat protein
MRHSSCPSPHRPRTAAALVGLTLLILLLGSAVDSRAQTTAKKLPLPDAAALADARTLVHELFEEDFKKAATDPKVKNALVGKLLEQAGKTRDDPTGRFALLAEARDLAAQVGDPARALQVVAELGRDYPIDVPEATAAALAKAAQALTKSEDAVALVKSALALSGAAIDLENYPTAMRLAGVAEVAARAAKEDGLTRQAAARKQEALAVQKAAAVLHKDPEDPEANRVVGKCLCLTRGRWETGLPRLAKCADPKLKDLAVKDLAQPKEPKAQVAAGDGWWTLAQDADQHVNDQLCLRAHHWYSQALPGLTGLLMARVSKRIDQVKEQVEGLRVQVITEPGEALRAVGFSPKGRLALLLVELNPKTRCLRLWDLESGKQRWQVNLPGSFSYSCSAVFTPDGGSVLVGSADDLRLWNVADGKEIRRFVLPAKASAERVVLSRDGTRALAVTSYGQSEMTLWEVKTGKKIKGIPLPTEPRLCGLGFANDGNCALCLMERSSIQYGTGYRVEKWDLKDGKQGKGITGPAGSTVFFTADGSSALFHTITIPGVSVGGLTFWNLVENAFQQWKAEGAPRPTCAALVSTRAVTGHSDVKACVRLWDLGTGKEIQHFAGHTSMVVAVTFTPDGRYAYSAGHDRTIRLWKLPR